MTRFFTLSLTWCLSVFSGQSLATPPLNIGVAANVQFAFEELRKVFVEQTGLPIQPIFASSGKITAQVEAGSPLDIFLSADTEYPEALYQKGLAAEKPVIYAYGTLVLWTLDNLDVEPGLSTLATANVKKIALANPKLAPYGREAMRAMAFTGVAAAVADKFVFGESISQVNQYVTTRVVDVGFTAKSVVLSPSLANRGKWVEVPKESYAPIAQAALVLKHGIETNSDAAVKFMRLLQSDTARQILAHYGYGVP